VAAAVVEAVEVEELVEKVEVSAGASALASAGEVPVEAWAWVSGLVLVPGPPASTRFPPAAPLAPMMRMPRRQHPSAEQRQRQIVVTLDPFRASGGFNSKLRTRSETFD